MSTRRILVVSAGLGQPSSTRLLADRLAAATSDALLQRGVSAQVDVLDLRDHAHGVMDAMLTGFPTGELREALERLAVADGVIAVTPVFQASYSGLFKSFFDLVGDGALRGTPVLLAATAGTARHSLVLEHAMRPMFSYLKAVTVPTAVFGASEDWGAGPTVGREGSDGRDRLEGRDGLEGRIDAAAQELAGLVADARSSRPADPFGDPVPFEQLLTGS